MSKDTEEKKKVNYGEGVYGENNPIDFDTYLSPEHIDSTRNLLKTDFSFFILFFYRYIYHDSFRFMPFHDEIIKSLEEFVYGNPEKKNLAICISPRWGKSIIMVMWIPWCFAINPRCNFIYTCYEERITNKMSDDMLNIIRSPFYKMLFGVELSGSTESKALWETKEKGSYRASPLGGAMTGFGCFTYSTLVSCENGYRKIGEMVEKREKVKVLSFDSKKTSFEDIGSYIKNDDSKFVRIITNDGEIIDATPDHIFHTKDGEKRCDELTRDSILLSDSSYNVNFYTKFFRYCLSRIIFVADKLSFFVSKSALVPSVASTTLKTDTFGKPSPINATFNVGDVSKIDSVVFGDEFVGSSVRSDFTGNFGRHFSISNVMTPITNTILFIIGLCSIRKVFERVVKAISVKVSNNHSFFWSSQKSKGKKLVKSFFDTFSVFRKTKSLISTRIKRFKNLIRFSGEDFSCFRDGIPLKLRDRRIFAIYNIHNKPSYCLTLESVNNLLIGKSRIFVHNCGTIGNNFGGAFLIDDPLNAKFFNSIAEKSKVLDVYQSVVKKRLNNPAKTPIVMIMQRLATDDLVGYIKEHESEDWKFIEIPALNENVNPPKSNWEWKSPTDVLLKEKKQSPYVFAAQMQQKPIVLGGELCKEEWFKYYNKSQHWSYRKCYMVADTAFKNTEYSDYTAVGLFGLTDQKELHLIDMLHKKINAVDLHKEILAFWNKWSKGVCGRRVNGLHIEDKASGMQLIQDLRRTGGIPIIPFKDRGFDKLTKWNELFPNIESGNVYLPNNRSDPVSSEVVSEMVQLCGDMSHAHDDIADMMYMGNDVAFNRKGIF